MSESEETELERIMRKVYEAANEVRKIKGDPLIEFVVPKPPYCSFCGKGENEVRMLIKGPEVEGPEVSICDECVIISLKILNDSGYFEH